MPSAAAAQIGVTLFDVGSLPAFVLKESALQNNLAEMAQFCQAHDVKLAPHLKTHMTVGLWRRQESAGATAVSVASVEQAKVFAQAGAQHILIANEVVTRADILELVRMSSASPDLELAVLVDSVTGVEQLASILEQSGAPPLAVLLEVGAENQRAGVRSLDEAREVLEAVSAASGLRLTGVEGYEGLFAETGLDERIELVRRYLDFAGDVIDKVLESGLSPLPLEASFGGSVFYPAVVELIRHRFDVTRVRVTIRSGCYLTHDNGMYAALHAATPSIVGKPHLMPAIEVWGAVLSTPEPGLAVIGAGRRDMSSDAGLPVPLKLRRAGRVESLAGCEVVRLNDQHALVRTPDDLVRVGDLVAFGISHPCTTFDKWRSVVIVDDDYCVLDVMPTRFH